ncbi:MAG TPA: SH3 domain-containing protein [Candidatus Ozemobacteraceae bacterium]|nr:SH3 domain-containing protein [Candidatus Ozemobacteraceae bacterium]
MFGGRWFKIRVTTAFCAAVLLLSSGVAFGSMATALYIRATFGLTDGSSVTGYCEVWNDGAYQPVPLAGQVTAPSGVNLREQADARSNALRKLPYDAGLIVLSMDGKPVEIEGKSAPWYHVRAGDLEGYVFGGFIRLAATAATGSYTYRPVSADTASEPQPLTGEVFMDSVIRPQAADPEAARTPLNIYREIHRLCYLPGDTSHAGGDAIDRNARFGYIASDLVELAWSDIRSARLHEIIEGDITPIIDLGSAATDLLKKPSLACFSVERYPEGVVSLISYNDAYTNPGQLEELLRSFLAGKTLPQAPKDAEWWFPIYDAAVEREFRSRILPENVMLLIFHVPD